MKTRRAKVNEPEVDEAQSLEVDLPDDMDFARLEELLPDNPLKQPTAQSTLVVYNYLLEQSREVQALNIQLEEMRSDSMRKEVELEQTMQEHELRFKELEESLSLKSNEAGTLKDQNKQLC
jgi:nucleoprotein TPR